MSSVFIDTPFLIAVLRKRDAHHAAALKWRKVLNGPFLTTEYVLVEVMDACCPPPLRRRGVDAIRMIREHPEVRIVPASSQLLDEGIGLFRDRSDKSWSLTDCISFVVMKREGITDALTSDRDFEQAGFRALMRMLPTE